MEVYNTALSHPSKKQKDGISHRKVEFDVNAYPATVSLYITPPTEEMSVEEFEDLAYLRYKGASLKRNTFY